MIQSKYLSRIFFSFLLVTGFATAEQAVTEAEAAAAANAQSTMDAAESAPAAAAIATGAEAKIAEAKTAADVMSTGSVARSAFATDIQDHEPADQITSLTNDSNKVYFFTELTGLQGQQAIHRWEYNGEVVADVQSLACMVEQKPAIRYDR